MFKFIKNKLSNKNHTLSTSFGFSIIELMVTVAIMTIITGVTLVSQTKFSSNVSLETLAYEIALTIREAQFFGMNVRELGVGTSNFDSGYGIYLDMSNPTSFIFFADINNNHIYDGAGEFLDFYNITQRNKLSSVCVDNGSGCSSVSKMYVTFKRPEPDAFIRTNNVLDCGATGCGFGKIIVSSPRDSILDKVVTIGSTGQISIGN